MKRVFEQLDELPVKDLWSEIEARASVQTLDEGGPAHVNRRQVLAWAAAVIMVVGAVGVLSQVLPAPNAEQELAVVAGETPGMADRLNRSLAGMEVDGVAASGRRVYVSVGDGGAQYSIRSADLAAEAPQFQLFASLQAPPETLVANSDWVAVLDADGHSTWWPASGDGDVAGLEGLGVPLVGLAEGGGRFWVSTSEAIVEVLVGEAVSLGESIPAVGAQFLAVDAAGEPWFIDADGALWEGPIRRADVKASVLDLVPASMGMVVITTDWDDGRIKYFEAGGVEDSELGYDAGTDQPSITGWASGPTGPIVLFEGSLIASIEPEARPAGQISVARSTIEFPDTLRAVVVDGGDEGLILAGIRDDATLFWHSLPGLR